LELDVAAPGPGWPPPCCVLVEFSGVITCCSGPSANTPATTMATAPATARTGLSQVAAGPHLVRLARNPGRAGAPGAPVLARCAAGRRWPLAGTPAAASTGPTQATSGRSRASSGPSTLSRERSQAAHGRGAASADRAPATAGSTATGSLT